MKTIKAARLEHYGGVEAIRVEDVSLPEPKPNEILIRVHAAGVNPSDWKIRAGAMKEKMPLRLPVTLGGDFSGIVEAVGSSTNGSEVGGEVYGHASVMNGGSGSFAELVIAPAGSTSAKPRSIGHEEAATLPLAGVSALQALTEHLRLTSGEHVLIHGGAGGIGSIAIQIARHLGARITTTASAQDIDYVKGLGAETVIDYKTQKFEDVVHDADAVFDTVGGDTYVRSFTVLRRGGRLVSMLEQPRQDLISRFGVQAFAQLTKVTSERLSKLAELIDAHALSVHIDQAFPLAQAGQALEHLERDSPRGKVVLQLV